MDPREPCLRASGLFSRMHGSQSCLADTDMLPPCATAHTQTFNSLWTSAMLEYESIHNAMCATFVMLPPCALAHAHTHTTSLWTSARHAILVSLHAHTTMRNTALVECSLSLLSSARGALEVRQRAPCLLAAGRSRPRYPVSSLLLVCVAPMCSRTPPGSVSQPSTSGMPEYVLVHIRMCTNQDTGAGRCHPGQKEEIKQLSNWLVEARGMHVREHILCQR